MNAPAKIAKPGYPGRVAIRHVVESARAVGLDVAGIEVAPDGTIRVLGAPMAQQPKDLFEEWRDKL